VSKQERKDKMMAKVLSRGIAILGISLNAGLLLTGSSVSASPPVKSYYEYTSTSLLTGLADFDITVNGIVKVSEIDFFDKNGNLIRLSAHVVEQDTFTANGKTLASEPYVVHHEIEFDGAGNPTRYVCTGLVVKVPLPGGGIFVSAGLLDWLAHPNEVSILEPDHGGSVNLEAFIEALSP
jgi:hypothetical protein